MMMMLLYQTILLYLLMVHHKVISTRRIYDENGTFVESKPSRGTFICTNHHCHATTMSRDLMSSELMGTKAITATIGFPLPSLARKNDPKSYQNAEKALAVLLQVSTSLKQDLTGALEGDFYI